MGQNGPSSLPAIRAIDKLHIAARGRRMTGGRPVQISPLRLPYIAHQKRSLVSPQLISTFSRGPNAYQGTD